MNLPDLRGANWADVWPHIRADRLAVYDALAQAGPAGATGSELAAKMGRGVLSVRPRLTELRQLYLAETTGERRAGEHVLRFVDRRVAEMRWTIDQISARDRASQCRTTPPTAAPQPAAMAAEDTTPPPSAIPADDPRQMALF